MAKVIILDANNIRMLIKGKPITLNLNQTNELISEQEHPVDNIETDNMELIIMYGNNAEDISDNLENLLNSRFDRFDKLIDLSKLGY